MFVCLGDVSTWGSKTAGSDTLSESVNYAVLDLDDLVCEVVSGRDLLRFIDSGYYVCGSNGQYGLCGYLHYLDDLMQDNWRWQVENLVLERKPQYGDSIAWRPFCMRMVKSDVCVRMLMQLHTLYISRGVELCHRDENPSGFRINWVFDLGHGVYLVRVTALGYLNGVVDLYLDMLDGSLLQVAVKEGAWLVNCKAYGDRRNWFLSVLAKWELLRSGIPLFRIS